MSTESSRPPPKGGLFGEETLEDVLEHLNLDSGHSPTHYDVAFVYKLAQKLAADQFFLLEAKKFLEPLRGDEPVVKFDSWIRLSDLLYPEFHHKDWKLFRLLKIKGYDDQQFQEEMALLIVLIINGDPSLKSSLGETEPFPMTRVALTILTESWNEIGFSLYDAIKGVLDPGAFFMYFLHDCSVEVPYILQMSGRTYLMEELQDLAKAFIKYLEGDTPVVNFGMHPSELLVVAFPDEKFYPLRDHLIRTSEMRPTYYATKRKVTRTFFRIKAHPSTKSLRGLGSPDELIRIAASLHVVFWSDRDVAISLGWDQPEPTRTGEVACTKEVSNLRRTESWDAFVADAEDDHITSLLDNWECTSYIEEPFMIEELVDAPSINYVAKEVVKDGAIVKILEELLETLSVDNSQCTLGTRVLQHFYKVKNTWENNRFIRLLLKDGLPCSMQRYNLVSSRKLAEFLMRKIRSDPLFKNVSKRKGPTSTLRSALSIWIGYWSNEDMILLLVYSIGRRSLCSNYIEEVVKDASIGNLANQLVKVPEAVALAKKLLISLQDDVPVEKSDLYDYHVRHRSAVIEFWFNPIMVVELVKALKKSTHLVNIFKKYSRVAQLLRCAQRMARIQKDPLLGPIFEGDQGQKMRGALSVLFGYWSDEDVTMLICTLHAARDSTHAKALAKVYLREEDTVEVFNYLIDGPGDVEGLKNVLADKYHEGSDEFMDRFLTINVYQERQEIEEECGYVAIVTVLWKNDKLLYFYMRRL